MDLFVFRNLKFLLMNIVLPTFDKKPINGQLDISFFATNLPFNLEPKIGMSKYERWFDTYRVGRLSRYLSPITSTLIFISHKTNLWKV